MSFSKSQTPRTHLSLLLLGVFAVPAFSQPVRPPASANAKPQSNQYTLGADDVISVTVARHPDLSKEAITISASGLIDLPEAGTIRVAGLTTRAVAQAIARKLNQTMVDQQVTVSLVTSRPRRIFVSGEINKVAIYDIKQGWRVSEALTAAGGPKGNVDETTATLTRFGMQPININLQTIQDNPDSSQNMRLLPGDSLNLTTHPRLITVRGAVSKPDVYSLRRAPRLLDAITAAGEPKDPEHVRLTLTRKGETSELNWQEAQNSPSANILLQAGDEITVETIPLLQVTVTGPFVKNAGNFQLATGSGVAQAIAQAGGLTVPPEQVVAGVRRGGEFIPTDLTRAGIDPTQDVPLKNGDLVLVNEPKIISVQVTGAVTRPSALRLPPQTYLNKAIADAGGLGIKPEDARISILRKPPKDETGTMATEAPRQTLIQVDPVALFTRNDLSQNVVLQEGDLVSVTQIQSAVVTISGEIKNPGSYTIQPGAGVAEVIARAGAQTGDAALTRVVLKRGTTSQTVDVYNAVMLGQKSDVTLQSGDFIVVPRNESQVIVMQAVQRPGPYSIPENHTLTVTDALNLAGGPRDRAVIKEVALLRPNPKAENGVERRILSIDKISKGDLSENITLRSGDIIYVPEAKRGGSLLGSLGQVIGTLTGLRYLSGS